MHGPQNTFLIAKVRALRTQTSRSVVECRQALVESEMDEARALEWLRKRGLPAKLNRPPIGHGRIMSYVSDDRRVGCLVEVLCDTDFAANTLEFQKLTTELAALIGQGAYLPSSPEIVHLLDLASASLGEPVRIGRVMVLGLGGPRVPAPPGTVERSRA